MCKMLVFILYKLKKNIEIRYIFLTADLFLCGNGIPINGNMRCDGTAQCFDGLDESPEHAGCATGM